MCSKSDAESNDVQSVIQLMSFRSFADNINIYAQVHLRDERNEAISKEIDIIFALDEYKATVMARNAICPGFSALIEIMMSSMSLHSVTRDGDWFSEYIHGCNKDIYACKLPMSVMAHFNYNYSLFVEAVFIECSLHCLGVCDESGKDVILNPTDLEIAGHVSDEHEREIFFENYPYILVLTASQENLGTLSVLQYYDSYVHDAIDSLHTAEGEFSIAHMNVGKTHEANKDFETGLKF